MIATTFGHAGRLWRSRSAGLAQRALDRVIEARTAQADKFVNAYLRAQNAASLKMLGFSDYDIRRLKGGTPVRSILQ
jgi:hypothetical protein